MTHAYLCLHALSFTWVSVRISHFHKDISHTRSGVQATPEWSHPNQLHLWWPYFQIRPHSEIPEARTSTSFCSAAQLCLTLQPHGLQHARLPCPSHLPESTQTQVYWVGDAIQPSHPLSSPSSPAFNLSQHQGLFRWVSSLSQVQHQSFQWTFRADFI